MFDHQACHSIASLESVSRSCRATSDQPIGEDKYYQDQAQRFTARDEPDRNGKRTILSIFRSADCPAPTVLAGDRSVELVDRPYARSLANLDQVVPGLG